MEYMELIIQAWVLSTCLTCGLTQNVTLGESDADAVHVTLHPPTNLTVMSKTQTEIYLFWYPPQNFVVHKPPNDTTWDMMWGNGTGLTVVWANETHSIEHQSEKQLNETGYINVSFSNNSKEDSTNDTDEQVETSKLDTVTKQIPTVDSVTIAGSENETEVEDYANLEGLQIVPFHKAHIEKYIVTYYKKELGSESALDQDVETNRTEYTISGLESDTEYVLSVAVVYITKTVLHSENITVTTAKSKNDLECDCNILGTVGGAQKCNRSTVDWCKCKKGYGGLFCEVCGRGYYRLMPDYPCYSCPCTMFSSSGTCHLVEGYLQCHACREAYTGNLCRKCAEGYTRGPRSCVPCSCHGNHNPLEKALCDPDTGACINCYYNTTGFSCERCRPGLIGDPVNGKPCTGPEKHWVPPTEVIAGVCVVIILVISIIVGYIVYRKWRNFPARKPFWTVELKEGQEGVSFSSVADEDVYMEDMDFYEKQGRQQGRKSEQPYSPLRETV